MIMFPLHTILRLLGNESKVHSFPAIFFQEVLPTRVKSHLARFPQVESQMKITYVDRDGWDLSQECEHNVLLPV